MNHYFVLFFWMLVAHALCDFPLQGEFLATGKNRNTTYPGVPWWICLVAHAAIHAGAVALVTGNVWLGVLEFLIHVPIDYLKCEGAYGFAFDQGLHVACKLTWLLLIYTNNQLIALQDAFPPTP